MVRITEEQLEFLKILKVENRRTSAGKLEAIINYYKRNVFCKKEEKI